MMAVAVETKPTFAAAKPSCCSRPLRNGPLRFFGKLRPVSPDGQRFLMIKASEQESAATQVNVVLNWSDENSAASRPRANDDAHRGNVRAHGHAPYSLADAGQDYLKSRAVPACCVSPPKPKA